jgi:hypothetical protein
MNAHERLVRRIRNALLKCDVQIGDSIWPDAQIRDATEAAEAAAKAVQGEIQRQARAMGAVL